MENFKRFAKVILIIFIGLLVMDLLALGYNYIQCKRAMKDALSNIATIVAEENCLTNENLETVKEFMVSNAPVSLCYNDTGYDGPVAQGGLSYCGAGYEPTNIVQKDMDEAVDNVHQKKSNISKGSSTFSAINISGESKFLNESKFYDQTSKKAYVTCPNRGKAITITVKAELKMRFLVLFFPGPNISIPLEEQVTVVGMRYYKSK